MEECVVRGRKKSRSGRQKIRIYRVKGAVEGLQDRQVVNLAGNSSLADLNSCQNGRTHPKRGEFAGLLTLRDVGMASGRWRATGPARIATALATLGI